MEKIYQAVIIGGGAAGYFAAIHAARQNPGLSFVLLEATARPLRKVQISGGGRCNVTHSCFEPRELIKNYPRGSKELLGPFMSFGPADTIDFFRKLGVELKTEKDGRMFPVTDDSQTILQTLTDELARSGCELRRNALVSRIEHSIASAGKDAHLVAPLPDDLFFKVTLRDKSTLCGRKILIATGSTPVGYEFAAELGHTIIKPVPSLFTFNCDDPRLVDQSGLSFPHASLNLKVKDKPFRFAGPLLITHWGLSGPAVLKLSAFAARELFDNQYQADLTINFLGDRKVADVADELMLFKHSNGAKSLTSPPQLPIPKNFWLGLMRYLAFEGRERWGDLGKQEIAMVAEQLAQARFAINGKGVFKDEFVTAGGVALKEINFKTMESKIVNGLYFAGEVLDIDGITGGFNFQNAWTTGFLAGTHLGKKED